jgi:hypothetical protein
MKRLSLFLLLMLTMSGCEQRELCMSHNTSYTLNTNFTYSLVWHEDYSNYNTLYGISLEWMDIMPVDLDDYYSTATPESPEGIRILVIKDGKKHLMSNVTAQSGSLQLTAGDYSLLFYNNDTEALEFSSDYSRIETITATTRTKTRASYTGNPYVRGENERTVTEPDMLFCCYVDSYNPAEHDEDEVMEIEMTPVVYTYLVNFYFTSGLQYVALVRGALAGMAESVNLADGSTSSEAVTVLFDCEVASNGAVAQVKSFGIPGYVPNSGPSIDPMAIDDDDEDGIYGLTLEVMLKNGTTKTFNFNVTSQLNLQPRGGVISVGGISISDEEGKSGGSSFQVNVDGWGEYSDVVLPMGQ